MLHGNFNQCLSLFSVVGVTDANLRGSISVIFVILVWRDINERREAPTLQDTFAPLQKIVETIAQRTLKRHILFLSRIVCRLVNLKILGTHPVNMAMDILSSSIGSRCDFTGTTKGAETENKMSLPHVKGGAFEGRSESLCCCRQSVRDGEISLRPVLVLHNWSQVLVHIIYSQH